MNGIEKITGRIEADAREQASAITADAEAKCAEIRAGYDKQAQDQYWARVRDGVKTCEDRVQRMGRLAEMEARKSVLALKQEMVDAAFAAALERICTMPQADYVAYLAKLAAQAARPPPPPRGRPRGPPSPRRGRRPPRPAPRRWCSTPRIRPRAVRRSRTLQTRCSRSRASRRGSP